MYMSLFSTCGWILRLGVTIALLASIHPALVLLAALRAADGAHLDLAARRRARASRSASRRRAGSPATSSRLATTAPPGKEVRVTRHRRAPGCASAARPGSAGTRPVARGAHGERRSGTRSAGRSSALALRRRDRVRGRGPRRAARRRAARAGGRLAAVRVHRRDRRRDRLPARHLDGRLAAPGLARGLRGLRWWRAPTSRCPTRLERRHPPRGRLASPTPAPTGSCSRTWTLTLPARRGGRARRRERRRQDHAREAAVQALRADRRARSSSTASPLARMPADDWRRTARRRVPGLLPLRAARAPARVGVGDVPRLDDDAGGRARPSARAGRGRRRRAAAARGLDTQLGPTWPDGRRGHLRPVAEARARARLHARRAAAAGARRADRRARRRDRARALRALRRGAARRATTATAASRSSSRTASAPCAWPT